MNAAVPDPALGSRRVERRAPAPRAVEVLYSPGWFIERQVANAERYLQAFVPFAEDEFGTGAAAPSPGHLRAANALMAEVRSRLETEVKALGTLAKNHVRAGAGGSFEAMLRLKDSTYAKTNEAERLVAFYRNIFDQRRGRFAEMLLPVDRIARNCYQAVWSGLGIARSIPAPSPFAYIEDGNGPATYRRGVRLTTLGRRPNPFPLVKVPQHR
ncbi:MAG: hypothetical protein WBN04_19295, partial [Paracoccaceae bacterium]